MSGELGTDDPSYINLIIKERFGMTANEFWHPAAQDAIKDYKDMEEIPENVGVCLECGYIHERLAPNTSQSMCRLCGEQSLFSMEIAILMA